jgi:stage II sporulation protein D
MLNRKLTISSFFLFFSFSCSASELPETNLQMQNFVRVRLGSGQVNYMIKGHHFKVQGVDEKPVKPVSVPPPIETIKISQVKINDIKMWKVQGPKSSVKLIQSPFLLLQGEEMQIGEHYLPKQVFFAGENKPDLIGLVPLEEYVAGVVSSEMPWSWPLEALKAQAVAARSYVLAQMRERKHGNWQVESTVLDQVYKHLKQNSIPEQELKKVSKINQAISETAGVILKTNNGKPLKSYYHADCGGKTASSKSVWGSKELIGGVVDSSCPRGPAGIWSYKIAEKSLAQKLGLGEQKLVAFNLERSSDYDRITNVKIDLKEGEVRDISPNQMRKLVGYNEIRSTNFSVQKNGNEVVFQGKGFGHGVGLCQWGTRSLAENGMKYKDILKHYYPESVLK